MYFQMSERNYCVKTGEEKKIQVGISQMNRDGKGEEQGVWRVPK